MRLHNGVAGVVKVLGCVASGRGVAASNMAADQTHAQLRRFEAEGLAFLACPASGFYFVVRIVQVLTLRHRCSQLDTVLDERLATEDSPSAPVANRNSHLVC